jgi:hypothetical protein
MQVDALATRCMGGNLFGQILLYSTLPMLKLPFHGQRSSESTDVAEGLYTVSSPENPKCNIVFVHGVHGHHQMTWHPLDAPEDYWPNWVAQGIPSARVYALQYNAFLTRWTGGTMSLFDRAGNVLAMADNSDIFALPTIFIAHSFGGLVIKQLWRECHDRGRKDVLQHLAGIIFLSTPHVGSDLSRYLEIILLKMVARPTITADELRHNAPQLRNLNTWYRNHPIKHTFVHFETQPTEPVGVVVDESSADMGLPNVYPIGWPVDHVGICKPKTPVDELAKAVLRNINEVLAASVRSAGEPEPGVISGTSLRSQFSDLQSLCQHIIDLLDENKHYYERYGPDSAPARGDVFGYGAGLWREKKTEILIPNNRSIVNIVRNHRQLMTQPLWRSFLLFEDHARAFERPERLERELYPRFPVEFDRQLRSHTK